MYAYLEMPVQGGRVGGVKGKLEKKMANSWQMSRGVDGHNWNWLSQIVTIWSIMLINHKLK